MAQISFKVPDEELVFLKWYSESTSNSISTIYREITLDTFRNWKLDILCEKYSAGTIGFKQLCKLANISYTRGLLVIEERALEPPISEMTDNYTEMVTDRLLDTIVDK